MTLDEYNLFCKAQAHTSHVVQWGGAHVWKVGRAKQSKVFAIAGWQDDEDQLFVTFKTSEHDYEILRNIEGCRPAPYLASRGMKWIQRMTDVVLSDIELEEYILESYRLVSLNLTKKLQKELNLNQN